MMTKKIFFSIIFLSFVGCYRVPERIEPQIDYQKEESYLDSLQPAFAKLSYEDRNTLWGKEYSIALVFAKDFDLYRSISTFKRALILLDEENEVQRLQIQYNILLCYFLAKKYADVIRFFEKSDLDYLDSSFPIFHDLLLVLYTSYLRIDEIERAESILKLLQTNYPETAQKLQLSVSLLSADIQESKELSKNTQYEQEISSMFDYYEKEKKSISKAQFFNAIFPGAGYCYLGQKRTGLTSFLINGLFIAGAVHFFHNRQFAAGMVFASFEAGWYFGGIYGAGLEARYYNERVYEQIASSVMNHYKLFPIFQLRYGF